MHTIDLVLKTASFIQNNENDNSSGGTFKYHIIGRLGLFLSGISCLLETINSIALDIFVFKLVSVVTCGRWEWIRNESSLNRFHQGKYCQLTYACFRSFFSPRTFSNNLFSIGIRV